MWGNLLSQVADAAKEELTKRASSGSSSERNSRGSGSGGSGGVNWAELASGVGAMAVDALDRKAKQLSMPTASAEDLELALIATKLSAIAYAGAEGALYASEEEASAELSRLGGELIHWCRQPVQPSEKFELRLPDKLPQWFIAKRGARDLYLVFRGTASHDDVLRDVMAVPEEFGGLRFHKGFLGGVLHNEELKAHLRSCLDGMTTGTHLHIFGHSLGGSLAMVLPLVQGFIPPSFDGPITVVAVGSPPVLHAGEAGVDEQCIPASARRARVVVIVNASDIVPRCLGSPLPLATSATFQAAAERAAGPDRPTKLLLSVIPEYAHLAQTSVLLLRRFPPPTVGIAVPANERKHVLHLHESLSVNLVADHGCEMYVSAIEAALQQAAAEVQ